MGDDDNDFEKRFALRVKPDTRIRQVRHFKPEVIEKLKAMKKDMKTSIISTDQFNNKKQKQNKDTQSRFKDELKIAGLVKGYDNARNRLMRLRNQIQENERIPEKQKEKLVERYNEMIQNIVAKSNMAMRDIEVSFLEDLLN